MHALGHQHERSERYGNDAVSPRLNPSPIPAHQPPAKACAMPRTDLPTRPGRRCRSLPAASLKLPPSHQGPIHCAKPSCIACTNESACCRCLFRNEYRMTSHQARITCSVRGHARTQQACCKLPQQPNFGVVLLLPKQQGLRNSRYLPYNTRRNNI